MFTRQKIAVGRIDAGRVITVHVAIDTITIDLGEYLGPIAIRTDIMTVYGGAAERANPPG
jgi:hypothetical protein